MSSEKQQCLQIYLLIGFFITLFLSVILILSGIFTFKYTCDNTEYPILYQNHRNGCNICFKNNPAYFDLLTCSNNEWSDNGKCPSNHSTYYVECSPACFKYNDYLVDIFTCSNGVKPSTINGSNYSSATSISGYIFASFSLFFFISFKLIRAHNEIPTAKTARDPIPVDI